MNSLGDECGLSDTSISTVLVESKPVYIPISHCLWTILLPTVSEEGVPFFLSLNETNQLGLEAIVAKFFTKVVKLAASWAKIRVTKQVKQMPANMSSGKGHISSYQPHFLRAHWEAMSITSHSEVVTAIDTSSGPIFIAHNFSDCSLDLKTEKDLAGSKRIAIGVVSRRHLVLLLLLIDQHN
ncbi:hypothetical protein AMTR_s00016p00121780 [Amborella trichopoda]|uniref:Uncharacterized protein n=1 Tax=Amborella trichopoda TaxID=13333 RepID=W1PER6_AMBTC|nr:hypothetical protein AMTR_s00016p00121780 [Amborella trichopoda]